MPKARVLTVRDAIAITETMIDRIKRRFGLRPQAHTRRKFFDVHEATASPIAAEALRRIAELYAIETSIRGRTAEERRSVRNTQSRPLVEAMRPWLETQLGRIPGRGGRTRDPTRRAGAQEPSVCRLRRRG
jgi:hypothetical protein